MMHRTQESALLTITKEMIQEQPAGGDARGSLRGGSWTFHALSGCTTRPALPWAHQLESSWNPVI